jgi:hypothetical protein
LGGYAKQAKVLAFFADRDDFNLREVRGNDERLLRSGIEGDRFGVGVRGPEQGREDKQSKRYAHATRDENQNKTSLPPKARIASAT